MFEKVQTRQEHVTVSDSKNVALPIMSFTFHSSQSNVYEDLHKKQRQK